jgi:hypothetical protein
MIKPCTVTLDMKLDDDVGTPYQLWQAIKLLTAGDAALPSNTLKLTFVTADETGAEKLEAELELRLQDREYGVVAEITRKSKYGLSRKMPRAAKTPIEREIDRANAAQEAEPVEGVAGNVITLTPAMLEANGRARLPAGIQVLELQAPLSDRIVEALDKEGGMSVTDLSHILDEAVDTVTAELERLREANEVAQDGPIWYVPDPTE